jgi:hypothetical protein
MRWRLCFLLAMLGCALLDPREPLRQAEEERIEEQRERDRLEQNRQMRVGGPPPEKRHQQLYYGDSAAGDGPNCVKGKRCGNTCIAAHVTCHK